MYILKTLIKYITLTFFFVSLFHNSILGQESVKIKSCQILYYDAQDKFGDIIKGDLLTQSTSIYDKNGNQIEYNFFAPQSDKINESKYKFQYEFNEHGKKIQESFLDFKNDRRSLRKYDYDTHNRLVSESHYENDDKLLWKVVYKYGNGNRISDETYYDQSGSMTEKSLYKYDSNNNIIELKEFDSEGKIDGISKYKYDASNYLIEEVYINAEGKPQSIRQYKLDERGNKTEFRWYTNNFTGESVQLTRYVYDSDNNLTDEMKYNEEDKLVARWKNEYKFDEHGNVIEELRLYFIQPHFEIYRPGSITQKKYEYY